MLISMLQWACHYVHNLTKDEDWFQIIAMLASI
jgi:hypothetical protein